MVCPSHLSGLVGKLKVLAKRKKKYRWKTNSAQSYWFRLGSWKRKLKLGQLTCALFILNRRCVCLWRFVRGKIAFAPSSGHCQIPWIVLECRIFFIIASSYCSGTVTYWGDFLATPSSALCLQNSSNRLIIKWLPLTTERIYSSSSFSYLCQVLLPYGNLIFFLCVWN